MPIPHEVGVRCTDFVARDCRAGERIGDASIQPVKVQALVAGPRVGERLQPLDREQRAVRIITELRAESC